MNRRIFMRSLGAAVAVAMLPFARPIKLSAPKKAKEYVVACQFWLNPTRIAVTTDEGYRRYMAKLAEEVKKSPAHSQIIFRYEIG